MSYADAAPLSLDDVQLKIAELIHEYMGIEAEQVLKNTPFAELHNEFDSLAMLEVQLLLEKHYGFELELPAHDPATAPSNVQELAREVMVQYQRHREKQKVEPPEQPPGAHQPSTSTL